MREVLLDAKFMEDDSEILDLLKKGDERAIEYLFDRFFDYLCSVVYRVIHDYESARDIVQDLFMEIWKKRETMFIQIGLRPYLRRAAVNRGLNYIKRRKIVSSEYEDAAMDIPSDDVSGQLNLERDELEQRIHNAIDGLPPKCKLVFSMSRFENMSYNEIAQAMEISVKTVENQISKALRILRLEVQMHMSD